MLLTASGSILCRGQPRLLLLRRHRRPVGAFNLRASSASTALLLTASATELLLKRGHRSPAVLECVIPAGTCDHKIVAAIKNTRSAFVQHRLGDRTLLHRVWLNTACGELFKTETAFGHLIQFGGKAELVLNLADDLILILTEDAIRHVPPS